MNPVRNEPVATAAVIQAVIVLIASFGLHLTVEQIGAIMTLTTFVIALWARSRVTPVNPTK